MKSQTFTFAPSTVEALEKIKATRGINKSRFVETAVITILALERFAPDQVKKISEMVNPNQIDMLAEIDRLMSKSKH